MLHLDQISVPENREGQRVASGEDSVDLVSASLKSERYLDKVEYNDKRGTLVLTRQNGEMFTIGGLPTASMIRPGKAGPKGFSGLEGREGRDGRDGEQGKKGCPGLDGLRGKTGDVGEDGEDGPDGPDGLSGYPGIQGDRGDLGPGGPTGPWGPDGEPGSACLRGEQGPQGPAPIEVAIETLKEPTDPAVFVWLYPSAVASPVPQLPVIQPLVAAVSNMTLVSQRLNAGSDIYVIDSYLPVNVRGGKGPFSYKWTILDDKELPGVLLFESDMPSVRVKFAKRLGTDKKEIYKGRVMCVVTDEGQQKRPTAQATSEITVVAYNPQVVAAGCIVSGSVLHTASGPIAVQDLRVGQMVMGYTRQPQDFRGWSSDFIDGRQGWAEVLEITPAFEKYYYLINDQGFTHEQPILVLEGKVWKYLPARDVKVGMKTVKNDGTLSAITVAQKVYESQMVYDVVVSTLFCYFVGDSLTHNLDQIARQEKS